MATTEILPGHENHRKIPGEKYILEEKNADSDKCYYRLLNEYSVLGPSSLVGI